MRITVTHNKSKQEVIQRVNDSVDEFFRGVPLPGFQVTGQRKSWNGDTLDFAFTAKVGFMSQPMSGKVVVNEHDLTVDIDLPPFLSRLIPDDKMKSAVQARIRGLLT